jgi:D-alanyl-D-alanine dipeptidase
VTVEITEGVDVALKVQEACRKETGRALARLLELAETAADPKVRSEAGAALDVTLARLLEIGLDLSRLVERARASTTPLKAGGPPEERQAMAKLMMKAMGL